MFEGDDDYFDDGEDEEEERRGRGELHVVLVSVSCFLAAGDVGTGAVEVKGDGARLRRLAGVCKCC